MTTQQYPDFWVYFGDGNASIMLECKEVVNSETGLKYYRFILIPSKRIESQYDISEEQDKTGAIVREYLATDVLFLERGTYRTRVWVYCNFNGEPTVASRRYQELTSTINDTDRLLRSAEAGKNRLIQELNMERQQHISSIKIQSDIIKTVASARGRVDGEGGDMMSDAPPEG